MKKCLLAVFALLVFGVVSAQDTVTGWTFPVNSGADSLNADLGTDQNKSYDIRFQWVLTPTIDSTLNTIIFVDGATNYAAATAGWDNGADAKFWSAKFKASGYTNFKVSSKQKSDSTLAGPRDFKLQWRLSTTSYEDVPNSNVTLAADWTTGVVTELPVPITNQGTGSIFIRWIMSSNTDVKGGIVAATGISAIDDIIVTATAPSGQNEMVYSNRLQIYPNPNKGNFTLQSTEPLTSLSVFDASGKMVYNQKTSGTTNQAIALPNAKPGIYFLKVMFMDDEKVYSTRIIVE
ncbi:MAG: T9SS type A sorting domain-containing protein [Bacteroidales bacterium]|nr:T9SS type A sorting domain-containing protein [Bacteroidales bacterium]